MQISIKLLFQETVKKFGQKSEKVELHLQNTFLYMTTKYYTECEWK